ncbi:DUF3781 domain-containing protein [Tenacibaculum dicentrarchi]|uniref:DUF3781 domain-containing protein n=1 Tax=Tenacibaculum dicentrarchi TaxID=669041 RepID=A0ABP1EE41_9FLAO|nr:DUF3781 domain-containing protein [Tenacibaculum dicentrarchi]MCG8838438.1 DUF3781 domain-containing protein [Tenacibaculum dicentrarchi]SOS48811.1 conserved hypothetical protein [Tenacibaculum dicentrarchi]SOS52633.1 conserved hypothetical protein [Tenacibaculum dicentrarchi]SOU87380.1 conserved hypothetical protein [Tenacibaculum dicentrarchi]
MLSFNLKTKLETIKHKILKNHCYTELVYQRINKKLGIAFSKFEIETLIQKVLEDTALDDYEKIGKNFYITNKKHNITITVNTSTFRIITVNQIIKSVSLK